MPGESAARREQKRCKCHDHTSDGLCVTQVMYDDVQVLARAEVEEARDDRVPASFLSHATRELLWASGQAGSRRASTLR